MSVSITRTQKIFLILETISKKKQNQDCKIWTTEATLKIILKWLLVQIPVKIFARLTKLNRTLPRPSFNIQKAPIHNNFVTYACKYYSQKKIFDSRDDFKEETNKTEHCHAPVFLKILLTFIA